MELSQFRLYSTLGCHLCEEALSILQDLHAQMLLHVNESKGVIDGKQIFVVKEIDIAESEHLISTFGLRIPVLVSPAGRELDWPFDIQQVYQFILPELNIAALA